MAAKKTSKKTAAKTTTKDAGLKKCAMCKAVELPTKRHQFCKPCRAKRQVDVFHASYAKRAGKTPVEAKHRLIGPGGALSQWAQYNPAAALKQAKAEKHERAIELLKKAA